MKREQYLLLGLTTAIFCLLLLPSIGQIGIFLDGLIYSTLARNLAENRGSFWQPYYTDTLFTVFSGHPPLAFNAEALFFRIFGDVYYVERLYSLVMAILTAIGVSLVWRVGFPKYKNHYWLPILLWLTMPVVGWSFKNNMLENTVSVFSIFAVFFIIKAIQHPKTKGLLWLILSALFIFFSFLTKGIATLFPFATIVIYALIHRQASKKNFLSQVSLLSLAASFLFLLIFLLPEAKNNLFYSVAQHFSAISSAVTVSSRWFIVGRLCLELLPILLLTLLVLGLAYRKNKNYFKSEGKSITMGWFWIGIGLAGTLPIMISQKQSGYYIVPALMFFALGFAAFLIPQTEKGIAFIKNKPIFQKGIPALSVTLCCLSLFLMVKNVKTYNRDSALIEDIKLIGEAVETPLVGISENYRNNWQLHAYFMRFEKISLDYKNPQTFMVIDLEENIPKGYTTVDLPLKKLQLLKQ